MGFAAEPGQTAGGVDGADVGADGLEGGEGAALGFDFAEDVFTDTCAEVCGGAGEPAAFLMQQVRRDSLRLLCEVELVAARFIESADGLVDFFSAYGAAGLEAIGGGEFGAGGLLRGDVVAEEDVAVCEGFFDDEGVGGVVVEGIAKGGGFGGALGGMVVAGCLDDFAEFAVGGCEAGVGFLDVHGAEFDTQVGFC